MTNIGLITSAKLVEPTSSTLISFPFDSGEDDYL